MNSHGGGAGDPSGAAPDPRDSSTDSALRMTPEMHKAIEAVRFIAAHLKNEDDYAEVRDNGAAAAGGDNGGTAGDNGAVGDDGARQRGGCNIGLRI